MAPVSARRRTWGVRSAFALLVVFGSGCKIIDKHCGDNECESGSPVARMIANWDKNIYEAPDPMRGGAPNIGLMGQIMLFGPDVVDPLTGVGELYVELYDHTPREHGGQPKRLEIWQIDPETFQRMLQRDDTLGWAYSVFLPWSTYRPDITKVYLSATFTPAQGAPVTAPGTLLALDHTSLKGVAVWQASHQVPAPAVPPSPAVPPTSEQLGMPQLILPEPGN